MQTELVDRARRGDREAFGVLAAASVDRLYAIARLVLRDTDLAEDATQDALVKAWRDLPKLRDPDLFDAWLRRILVRSCSDIGRRRRRWRTEISLVPIEPTEPDTLAGIADRDQIERGLRRLNEAQRTILILHFYVGLSPTEAASALEIPVGTAKSRLHYAIEALKAALAADERTILGATREGRHGMNPTNDFERRMADYYAAEAPPRAPDWVLTQTLETIDTTPQRWSGLRAARSGLPSLGLRRLSLALGGAVAVVAIAALALNVYSNQPAVGGPSPSDDPRSSFLGTWYSTSDADGGTQTMTVRASGEDGVEIVVTDTIASVCKGTPSTMTGNGSVDGSKLVIPSPAYACDDGSEPKSLTGAPLAEQLRNLTYVHDAQIDALTVGSASVWTRQVAAAPSTGPSPSPSAAALVDFALGNPTPTFVSPINGYTFKYIDRGGFVPATERWDPDNQPPIASNELYGAGAPSRTNSMSWRPALPPSSSARRRRSRTGSLSMTGSTRPSSSTCRATAMCLAASRQRSPSMGSRARSRSVRTRSWRPSSSTGGSISSSLPTIARRQGVLRRLRRHDPLDPGNAVLLRERDEALRLADQRLRLQVCRQGSARAGHGALGSRHPAERTRQVGPGPIR